MDRRSALLQVIPIALLVSLFGAAVGALSAAAVCCGLVITIGPVFVLGALPALLGDRAALMLGPRGRVFVALALVMFAPLIATRAAVDLDTTDLLHDFVVASTSSSGSFWLGVTILAVPIGAPALVFGWWVAHRSRWILGDAFVRGLYRVAIALGLALALAATVAHAALPLPAQWREQVPVVAHLHAGAFREVSSDELLEEQSFYRRDARVFRADTSQGAMYLVADLPHRFGTGSGWFAPAESAARPIDLFSDADGEIIVRYDGEHRITIIESVMAARIVALNARGERTTVSTLIAADTVAPPFFWTLTAVVGVALAIAIRRRGIGLRAELEARGWIPGRVVEDDIALLDDGTRVFALGHLLDTHVVACGVEPATTTFRNAVPVTADTIVAGTIADRWEEARAQETAHAAWATGLVALSVSPIAVYVASALFIN